MSYLSCLRAILYCPNNSSLFANINAWFTNIKLILLLIYEGPIHLSYSTFANQFGSLTYVKYKKLFFTLSSLNENSLLAIPAHKKLSHCFSFNIQLELWQIQFLKTRQTWNDQLWEGWSITVVFAPLYIHLHEEVNVFTIDQYLINFNSNCLQPVGIVIERFHVIFSLLFHLIAYESSFGFF